MMMCIFLTLRQMHIYHKLPVSQLMRHRVDRHTMDKVRVRLLIRSCEWKEVYITLRSYRNFNHTCSCPVHRFITLSAILFRELLTLSSL